MSVEDQKIMALKPIGTGNRANIAMTLRQKPRVFLARCMPNQALGVNRARNTHIPTVSNKNVRLLKSRQPRIMEPPLRRLVLENSLDVPMPTCIANKC